MWVGVEVATVSTVMMVGIYRTPEAIEAAWKYFILGSVGIALAFFGTILVYLVAAGRLGEGLAGDGLGSASRPAPRRSTRGCCRSPSSSCWSATAPRSGLAPFHAWLPDAHAEGPTPISAVLSGLLLNVALYALLALQDDPGRQSRDRSRSAPIWWCWG